MEMNGEGSNLENNTLSSKESLLIKNRCEVFMELFVSDFLNDTDRKELIIDEVGIAVFVGIKPAALLTDKARNIYQKFIQHANNGELSDKQKDVIQTLIVTDSFIIDSNSFMDLIHAHADELDIEVDDNFSISEYVETIHSNKNEDKKLGIVLGFPRQSIENYTIRSQATSKIEKYFLSGKENCVQDGWTSNEIKIFDLRNPEPVPYKVAILKKYQQKLGLTDDEISAFSSAYPFNSFGYNFACIPFPRTQYVEDEEKTLHSIMNNEKESQNLISFINEWKEKLHLGFLDHPHKAISVPLLVWEGLNEDDIEAL